MLRFCPLTKLEKVIYVIVKSYAKPLVFPLRDFNIHTWFQACVCSQLALPLAFLRHVKSQEYFAQKPRNIFLSVVLHPRKVLVITSVSLAFQNSHRRKITCRKQKPDNVAHPLSKISYPEAWIPQYRIVEEQRSVKCFCHYVGLFQLLHRAVFIRSDDRAIITWKSSDAKCHRLLFCEPNGSPITV